MSFRDDVNFRDFPDDDVRYKLLSAKVKAGFWVAVFVVYLLVRSIEYRLDALEAKPPAVTTEAKP